MDRYLGLASFEGNDRAGRTIRAFKASLENLPYGKRKRCNLTSLDRICGL